MNVRMGSRSVGRRLGVAAAWVVAAGVLAAGPVVAAPSHPPMRPLPVASDRPLAEGTGYYVDPVKGKPTGDGTAAQPWKTIEAGLKVLKPGDTLYLHGGVYFENVTIGVSGTPRAPITIRSVPGELAIVDGGIREMVESPRTAWEPVKAGAKDEFRSVREYAVRRTADEGRGVWVTGNFADSMVPLHGYRFGADLRSENQFWNVPDNASPGNGVYVGPGLWFDWSTRHIHVRLSPTTGQPKNYAGETDPRRIGLVVGIDHSAVRIEKASYVRLQDLVLRGSATRTLEIEEAGYVELDGVTVYGGAPAMWVKSTHHLKMMRSALRGTAAPWSSRASMKYRGNSPYLMVVDSSGTQSHDWEIAYNEFTDGHDGLVIDSLKSLAFHHNRIENFNDDAIYLTAPPRQWVPEAVTLYDNFFSRIYTVFAFADPESRGAKSTAAAKRVGPGVFMYRNVFDLREPTYTWIAKEGQAATMAPNRLCNDHGSPVWEPLMFYHNTVISAGPAFRDYYGAGMVAGTKGTKRRLFNNIFVQVDANPGLNVPGATDDVFVDGNLLWGVKSGPGFRGNFFANRKVIYEGFGANDRFADPRFTHLADGDAVIDVRPQEGGGGVDMGVKVPADWPDSRRDADRGKPDMGALPLGAPMLRVGPAAMTKR